jgi:threonine-phosphate decarboxylase
MDPDSVDGVDHVTHGSSEDPRVLDFSANINPDLPPGTSEVYAAALEESRRYPPTDYADYRAAAAEYVGCDPEAAVPTAGGLAAIRLVIATTVRPGDSVLVPFPSFGEYAREVRLQGGKPVFVRHADLLDADPSGYAMVVVCTPNNPTGDCLPPDDLRSFAARCREVGTTLLADEAFLGFTDRPSLAGAEGVVVARSLTKLFGLPGLRAGFAVATGPALDRLGRARPAWGLGTPAARVGAHAMRQHDFVRETRERVASERERMRERLETRFSVAPSEAPFLLLEVEDVDAVVVRCLAQDIAIRDARSFRGLDSHVRVAVRTREENDRLLEAIGV